MLKSYQRASFRDLGTQSEAVRRGLGFLNTRNLVKHLFCFKHLPGSRILRKLNAHIRSLKFSKFRDDAIFYEKGAN